MDNAMVIRQVSSLLSFDDLKIMRLISKKWHRIISCLPKFEENRCTVLTASSSVNRDLDNWFDKALAIPWREVYLKQHFYAVERGNFMKHLWPDMSGGGNVTKLVLSTVKISCGDACSLLNNAPGLTQVTFQSVMFNPNYACTRGVPPVQTFIYCTHLAGMQNMEYEELTRANVPVPTITTIKIAKQDSFPFCLMENLINRTRGTLIDLSIRESPTPDVNFDLRPLQFHVPQPVIIPPIFIPTWDEILPQILQLIRASTTSLRRFDFYKCGFGLHEFLDNNLQNNELTIDDLVLGTRLDNVAMNPQANIQAGNLMIGLVDNFTNCLQSLSLTIAYHEESRNALQNALLFLTTLKKLKIGIITSTQPPQVHISIPIPLSLKLKEIAICPRSSNRSRAFLNEFLSYDFLQNMDSTTLESLTLNTNRFYVREQMVQVPLNVGSFMINMLRNGRFRELKKICFWKGFTVTNCLFQSIIANLPQLEELSVRCTDELCDAGTVGVRQAQGTCTNCWRNEVAPVGHIINAIGHRISGLAELKMLNLYDCRCITDISLNTFAFPKLVEINLALCSKITNTGLLALGQNNPKLKTLILHRNPLITFQGIQTFLTTSRSINKIVLKNEPNLELLDPMYHGIIKMDAEGKIAGAPLGMGLEDMMTI